MKELVVISGKGGTGKTSLVASFAVLARNKVLADCDVDAADLHLILSPTIQSRESFTGGECARIKPGHCTACGKCEELCVFDAVYFDGPGNGRVPRTFRIDPAACEGCGVCAWFCAEDAIELRPVQSGECFVSQTRFGPMVHAKLGVGEENSGKLVSLVRSRARAIAGTRHLDLIIVDGSPGIGCPVIASVTGADLILLVTEPTLSGLHDMTRMLELAGHFNIRTAVSVNKFDINSNIAQGIEDACRERGVPVLSRIHYSRDVTRAMVAGKAVVEQNGNRAASDMRRVWKGVEALLI